MKREVVHTKIARSSEKERTIQRASAPKNFRNESEVQAAYEQVGYTPNRNTKSWYRDIYEFYQNNEC
jgi:hypothetical protein